MRGKELAQVDLSQLFSPHHKKAAFAAFLLFARIKLFARIGLDVTLFAGLQQLEDPGVLLGMRADKHFDDHQLARRMNEEVEVFVRPHPEQYTWILKLLKTRKEGDIEPYSRKEAQSDGSIRL